MKYTTNKFQIDRAGCAPEGSRLRRTPHDKKTAVRKSVYHCTASTEKWRKRL